MVMKVLFIKSENCTGCQMCELACSSTKLGFFNPDNSRIKIITNGLQGWSRPMVCVQCRDAPCLNTCPVDAILINEIPNVGKIIDINLELCIKCKQCIEACPFGVIYMGNDLKIIKCDLCNGTPQCVQFCSYKCLNYEEITEELYKIRMSNVDKLIDDSNGKIKDLNSYERRVLFSLDLTRIMSKKL